MEFFGTVTKKGDRSEIKKRIVINFAAKKYLDNHRIESLRPQKTGGKYVSNSIKNVEK